MSKKMHTSLVSSQKDELDKIFEKLKELYEKVEDFQSFYNKLQHNFNSNIDGFEHKLDIDFSAYDPNNYFKSLRIVSKEGDNIHSFEEFGTGEQQILLMSFIKAYAETFNDENFIFIVEEPEAHLHPLAQRWLFKNLMNISSNGVQVIISTHSPEFLDIKCLEGFVKVYKENGITKIIQNTKKNLVDRCIQLGVPENRVDENSILEYYRINTFYDELKGFFARKIILVEGATELFCLPYYFERIGCDLSKNGIEIINCRGKNQILRNYRLFKSYGYDVFCLFDGDSRKGRNTEFAEIYGFNEEEMNFEHDSFKYDIDNKYGYFGKDFESYMRSHFENYEEIESKIEGSKVLKAKIIAEKESYEPEFIKVIAEAILAQ
jgi:putative ATP-dependent endonuclease of OLD family